MSITEKRPSPFVGSQPLRPLFRECFQNTYGIERRRIVMPEKYKMRMNRGEQPLGLPIQFQRKIWETLAAYPNFHMQRYPAYQPFYEKLSLYTGFPTDQIVAGTGIEDFIRALTALCCDPGDTLAVTWPTCAMYGIHAKAFSAKIHKIGTDPHDHWSPEICIESLEEAGPGLRLVFLPNPGQPVETYLPPSEMRIVAEWCHRRNIVLAVDEAHWGFGAESAFELVKDFDNLVVMRTFSKLFAAASIRAGYVVGQKRVIQPLDAIRLSGEVSGPSMHAVNVLLDNLDVVEENAGQLVAGRDWFREYVNGETLLTGITASGDYGFSILLHFSSQDTLEYVGDMLTRSGILTKYNFEYPLDHCMLLACGPQPFMKQFYAELRTALHMLTGV